LMMLVTSRVMLHLRAEQLFEVSPLPLPTSGYLSDLETLSHYASIALFVQRAQAVAPDFQLTPVNAAAVAGICTRLDGIPLAIELAAARTRHFSPLTLLEHLEKGLTVLQAKVQDVPARQKTLHSAIAWSYDLLGLEEQSVFRRLAVFANGATLGAAEQVCTGACAIDGNVSEILEELVDKSMVQRQERKNGDIRFWLLQTLREFGVECLSEAGELVATQTAHAEYFLSWIEQIAPMLLGAEQADRLDQLDREYENVRVALEWMLEESLAIFKVIGERSGTAVALISLARVVASQGEHEAAQTFYNESWELLQVIGDREIAAACLEGYGQVLTAQGEARQAVQLWGIAAAVRAAIVAPMPPIYRPDYIQAVAAARESLSEEDFQTAWTDGSTTPLELVNFQA